MRPPRARTPEEPTQHWLTRSFRDPDLEADYLRAAAEAGRSHFRVAIAVGITGWVATALSDPQIGRAAANVQHLLVLRAVAAVLLVPVLVSGWLGVARFARLWQGAAMIGVGTVLATIVLMNATAPEAERFDYQAGLIGFSITIVAAYALLPLRFVNALVICVPLTITYGIVVTARFPYPPIVAANWLLLANLAGGAAGLLLEQSRREVFVYGRMLAAERARSDALIANLLPAPIAERLRMRPETIAEGFESATVLFADLVGFTPLAARLPPVRLVAVLDAIFTRFDELADRHGLEKIKTIGDAYMLVAGVPSPRADHAAAAADMALAMRDVVAAHEPIDGTRLSLRIGLHSGPLVAGVIGKKRPFYDLWGDTVNVASRMESHGVADGIQVTQALYELLRDRYILEERGALPIKGKGELRTWLLTARKPRAETPI